MALIPNKLQKQVVNNRCKGIHKYRRFSKKNKTYKTDCYYCANCGHQVKIENFFGYTTICWGCGKPFSVPAGQLKIFPKCEVCSPSDNKKIAHIMSTPDLKQSWMEESEAKDNVMKEMLDTLNELGIK